MGNSGFINIGSSRNNIRIENFLIKNITFLNDFPFLFIPSAQADTKDKMTSLILKNGYIEDIQDNLSNSSTTSSWAKFIHCRGPSNLNVENLTANNIHLKSKIYNIIYNLL